MDLTPETTWSHAVQINEQAGKVTFELKDRAGNSLLKQTEGEYDWDPDSTIKTGRQEALRFPEPAAMSADDWVQMGKDQELDGKALVALGTYETALEKHPQSQSLAVAAGRLAASLQQFGEAERLLVPAQKRDTSNSQIAYYLGIAEEGLGRTREAQTSYEIAYRQADLRGPAAIRLAELRAREGDLQGAAIFLQAAVAAQPANARAQEELVAILRASGQLSEADRFASLGLSANPLSAFLKEDMGKTDLEYLAADPYRVLRIAAEYMQLGLYRKALDVLDRNFPPAPTDQSEPGSVLPQKHPLVLYYVAFCKQKLGADAARNWQAASELSANLVFPSTDTDRVVLQAALAANGKDATAHYLLGTLLFSKGVIDEGMTHWAEAKQLAPHLQVVDVDMGNALLKVKGNQQAALEAFREAARDDAENPEGYVGLDEAMSVTGASAVERAAALSQYPSADAPDSRMPANLVYQLALTRAEAAQFGQALALFKNRFFASEEGGTTSGQVLFEVKLMQAESWTKTHNCTEVENFLDDKQPGMGLDGESTREYLKLAGIARNCGRAKQSEDFLHKAAAGVEGADLVWAIQAQKSLGIYNSVKANQRLTESLAEAERSLAASTHSGYWQYTVAMLQAALNQKEDTRESFEKAMILADNHMSHHLAREALAELSAGKLSGSSVSPAAPSLP
jgi:predicted Zn-dependent protease